MTRCAPSGVFPNLVEVLLQHCPPVAERVERELSVVGTHAAFPDPAERQLLDCGWQTSKPMIKQRALRRNWKTYRKDITYVQLFDSHSIQKGNTFGIKEFNNESSHWGTKEVIISHTYLLLGLWTWIYKKDQPVEWSYLCQWYDFDSFFIKWCPK
jgi:hypothetical protein